jgi:general stress protein 26
MSERAPSFETLAAEFERRVERTIWCTFATVDKRGRVRSRLVHPLWEGKIGWLLTGRTSHKARDLDANPSTSLTYWDQTNEQVHVDCNTRWIDKQDERTRIWNRFKETPFPHGYDPGQFFKSPEDPEYGVLRLEPWRLELWSLDDLVAGKPPRVWRA